MGLCLLGFAVYLQGVEFGKTFAWDWCFVDYSLGVSVVDISGF